MSQSLHHKNTKKIGFTTHRFRTTRKNITIQKSTVSYEFVETMMITELPQLPTPSKELEELLLKFNSLNESLRLDIQSEESQEFVVEQKKPKTGKMNGFLAYRTFYCKFILNPDHQRMLSKLLASLWINEINKSLWKTYAQAYNFRQNKKTPFVPWLCDRLNIGSGITLQEQEPTLHILKNEVWPFQKNVRKNVVEDLYLAKPQLNT